MHYQARKYTKTDPLDAILDHIQKNSHTYSKLFLMKGKTIKIHMVNTELETFHKAADKIRGNMF